MEYLRNMHGYTNPQCVPGTSWHASGCTFFLKNVNLFAHFNELYLPGRVKVAHLCVQAKRESMNEFEATLFSIL
jgi:hypothetical protein